MPERRNPVVRAGAILRKGGVHTKSVSGQRQRQKLRVDDAIDEWYDNTTDQKQPTILTNAKGSDQDISEVGNKRTKKRSNKGQSGTAPSFFLPSNMYLTPYTSPAVNGNQ